MSYPARAEGLVNRIISFSGRPRIFSLPVQLTWFISALLTYLKTRVHILFTKSAITGCQRSVCHNKRLNNVNECCMLLWTNPGTTTLRNNSCTAIDFSSRKPSKKEKRSWWKKYKRITLRLCTRSVVANVLDCNTVVSEFEIQSHYYVHFWTNIPEKGMNYLTHPGMD